MLTSIERVPGKGRSFFALFTPLNSIDLPEFYLSCSQGISVGTIISNILPGEQVHSFKKGFVAPISQIPQNNFAFNVESSPGCGTKFARAAGSRIYLQGIDLSDSSSFTNIMVKLPSGELKSLFSDCLGQIGSSSNEGHLQEQLGKAGRNRFLGRRPKVRGVAINPVDHPIGGGEGKASGGRPSVSPQGWHTKGRRTIRKLKK